MSNPARPPEVGRRRVLHLIDTLGPGGAETVLLDVASGLDPARWESLVAVPGAGWLEEQARARGLDVVTTPTRQTTFDWRYLLGLLRLVPGRRIDLIHAHLMTPSVYGGVAALARGIPVVATFHGTVDIGDGTLDGLKFRIINRAARGIAFVSQALRDAVLARTAIDRRLARVVHNGIDRAAFTPRRDDTLRRELGLKPGEILAGAVGNVRPGKAYDLLLRTAARLRAADSRVRFVIIGATNGPVYPGLQQLHHSLGLGDGVVFAGFRDDVARMFNNLDVYLMTSSTEGFSLTTVQALASGVPVIATRCGGPEEIVEHEQSGLLVDVGAEDQLAGAIRRLTSDDALRARLVQGGLARVARRFSREAMVEAYAGMYQDALGR